MLGLNKKIATLATALGVAFGYITNANASDISKPLPKLKAAEVLWANSSHFHKDFDKGVNGDCTSLLSRLDKAIQNEESEYAAHVVLGEMYDRAICVNFDPAKAYENFKRAADMGGPYYYAQVGWKHVHGHGAEQSIEKANDAFKLLLTRLVSTPEGRTYERYKEILIDRDMPKQLKDGINWLIQKSKTDDGISHLAKSLIYGGGNYYDNSPLSKDILAAKRILEANFDNGKASYVLANAYFDGIYGDKEKNRGRILLEHAGTCGSEQAVVDIIGHMLNEDHGFRNIDFITYTWFLYGKEKKYEGIETYSDKFKSPSYTMIWNTPDRLKWLNERTEKCLSSN